MKAVINGAKESYKKELFLPGDKSIAHRAVMIGSLPKGEFCITNYPKSLDCLATINCMRKLGIDIDFEEDKLYIKSPGYENFNKKVKILNAANSGTTARLISGIIAGCGIDATIDGDSSLKQRPMNRIIIPLREMGANIDNDNGKLPLNFKSNGQLKSIAYKMKEASAQVKSCILICGFLSDGVTEVEEVFYTRDHTEKLFKFLGAELKENDKRITIMNSPIICKDIFVPGDISSAAFLVACCLLSKNSNLILKNILLNKRRIQYIHILKDMGADIEIDVTGCSSEDYGSIYVKSSELHGIEISEDKVPNIIDEIPIISVLASCSEGKTVINGIEELKYKESDRIKGITYNLNTCGIKFEYLNDSLTIFGSNKYIDKDIYIKSYNDHRIAMAFTALAAKCKGKIIIDNFECTEISFPNATKYFKELINIEEKM